MRWASTSRLLIAASMLAACAAGCSGGRYGWLMRFGFDASEPVRPNIYLEYCKASQVAMPALSPSSGAPPYATAPCAPPGPAGYAPGAPPAYPPAGFPGTGPALEQPGPLPYDGGAPLPRGAEARPNPYSSSEPSGSARVQDPAVAPAVPPSSQRAGATPDVGWYPELHGSPRTSWVFAGDAEAPNRYGRDPSQTPVPIAQSASSRPVYEARGRLIR